MLTPTYSQKVNSRISQMTHSQSDVMDGTLFNCNPN